MYRCTECYTEYTELPDYCECGNDSFEEVFEEDFEEAYYEPEPQPIRRPPKQRRLSPEERAELAQEEQEKKRSLIAIGIIAILCVCCLFLPPHKKSKTQIAKESGAKTNIALPEVKTFWDDTLPSAHKTKDPLANLPLLNTRFRSISPVLREYLVDIGGDFDRKWDRTIVKGSGECKVEFTIDKEGNVVSKRIASSSHNESLNDSVLLTLSKITGYNMPPDDYKGERIFITFKVSPNRDSQVVYPMK